MVQDPNAGRSHPARPTAALSRAIKYASARELGTTSKVDTVNAALQYVADRRKRAEAFDDPLIWGSPDLADPDARARARY
jgi:hypothetical protein